MTSLSTNDKSPVPNLESQIPNKIEILTSLTFDNPLETNEKVHITEHITSSPKVSAPPPKEAEKSDWATIMNEEPEDKVLLEFYEFTRPDCKEALSGVLSQYRIPRDKYEVRWVDKSRAIGKFENEHIATQAKEALGPTGLFKIRRYSGTFDIKDPVYPPQFHRPLTTNSVARRLIHGALGLRAPVRTKEERERDHNLLRIAREEKEARIHPRIHHGLVDNRSM
ncbi:hypothetical protein CLU79DRAFT_153097 [Phycomyces nitens]|nr:hypothetical protein CLU79DRAFT_153097 [Phycomyces nitens]